MLRVLAKSLAALEQRLPVLRLYVIGELFQVWGAHESGFRQSSPNTFWSVTTVAAVAMRNSIRLEDASLFRAMFAFRRLLRWIQSASRARRRSDQRPAESRARVLAVWVGRHAHWHIAPCAPRREISLPSAARSCGNAFALFEDRPAASSEAFMPRDLPIELSWLEYCCGEM